MDIVCSRCGGENLAGDASGQGSRASAITMTCLDCGWRGSRTPSVSCQRCGSTDVHAVPIDQSWAYADLEEAREDPATAEWGYVEKTAFTCRKCHNEWVVPGEYRPYDPGRGTQLQQFTDNDDGYRSWIAAWPGGYVLNCERSPRADYLILHRAGCYSISELQPDMKTFTGEYVKVCSTDRQAVTQWSLDQTGASPTPCQHCI